MARPGFAASEPVVHIKRDGGMQNISHPSARPLNQPSKGIWPLLSLNFFMADMQAGIGPFLGVFLLAHGWQSGLIGTVMTVGGVAGMLMTTPAGALVDATRRKKLYVIIPGICTVIASGIILLSQNFWLVTLSQVATAIAGAAIGPAVSGITLGMVRQAGFNRQNGHNQALNHAGNMVGAGLSGLLGWQFGFTAVFWLAALFGVLSIVSVLMIPGDAIDDDEARGLDKTGDADAQGRRHHGAARMQAAADPRCRAGLFPSRQRRDAAALRAGRRRQQAGRSGRFRRDHHRRGAGRR